MITEAFALPPPPAWPGPARPLDWAGVTHFSGSIMRLSTIAVAFVSIAFAASISYAAEAPAPKPAVTKPVPPVKAPAKMAATETAPDVTAASLLGADVKGENWEVASAVHSDGFLRIFSVKTPYGDFQVNGVRRMKERINELRALSVLEKMSRTKAFGDALAKAGMAPIKFGRDLILDPVETTGNFVTGVGKMFNNIYTGVKNRGKGRDPLLESVIGITKAERDLAAELNVDPYTDFTPLRNGLEDVAHAIAAGDLTVTGALSAIPGGAGIAVGATSTASTVAASIKDKTSTEIAQLVTKKLQGMGVDEATTKAFVANTNYTPADQYEISDSLEKLGAANASAYIARANEATTADVAKFMRYRAELLAMDTAKLGTLKDFTIVSDMAINHDAKGRLVGAFPFDGVYWTDSVAQSLTRLSNDMKSVNRPRAIASTGALSPMATAKLKGMGWAVMRAN